MSRGRGAARGSPVSLFPFLAVLICTMGALIVLLVVLMQQARVEAARPAAPALADAASSEPAPASPPAAAAEPPPTEEELAEAERRRAELRAARDALRGRLAEERDRLSHLEDHLRRLQDEFATLAEQSQELAGSGEAHRRDREAAEAELERRRRELEEARAELDAAREEAAARPPAYAIVPYDGRSGVQRRPLYLECRGAEVILQPSGVRLTAEDFPEPLAPGNPLDAALRAAREYYARRGGDAAQSAYPLLLVRPDGVYAYAAARTALSGWEDDFGYELIDAEMELAFPPPDPALAEVQQRAVEDARRRQAALVAAFAARGPAGAAGAAGPRVLRASSSGGFYETSDGLDLPAGAGGYSSTARPGGTAADGADVAGGGAGERARIGAAAGGSFPGGPTRLAPLASAGGGDPAAGTAGGETGGGPAEAHASGGSGPARPGTPGAAPGGGAFGSGRPAPGAAGGMAGPSFGSPAEGAGAPPAAGDPSGEAGESLAESKGRDWALPASARGATAFTRPIRVLVRADRIVLIPERGTAQRPVEIPLAGATSEGIEPLVQAVWKRMEGWGLAGRGAYWRPVLRVQAAPGGEGRRRDLETLLRGSGFDVEAVP